MESDTQDFDLFASNVRSDLAKGRLTIHEAAQKYFERARWSEHGLNQLRKENAELRAKLAGGVVVPRAAIENCLEYWNGNESEKATLDALAFLLRELRFMLAAAEKEE